MTRNTLQTYALCEACRDARRETMSLQTLMKNDGDCRARCLYSRRPSPSELVPFGMRRPFAAGSTSTPERLMTTYPNRSECCGSSPRPFGSSPWKRPSSWAQRVARTGRQIASRFDPKRYRVVFRSKTPTYFAVASSIVRGQGRASRSRWPEAIVLPTTTHKGKHLATQNGMRTSPTLTEAV